MQRKYHTVPSADKNWTTIQDYQNKTVAIYKHNFIGLIGFHSAQTLRDLAQAIGRDIKRSTLIFPGNESHHTDRTTLYSHKAGGGLAALAGDCGTKLGSATLSFPTVLFGDQAQQKQVIDKALIDFWKVVGLGELVILPVRVFQSFDKGSTQFFSQPLLECDDTRYEPSFWGAINRQADSALAKRYLGHLYEGICVMAHQDFSLVKGQRARPLNNKYLTPYHAGVENAEKPVEERDAWYKSMPQPSFMLGVQNDMHQSGVAPLDLIEELDESSSISDEGSQEQKKSP